MALNLFNVQLQESDDDEEEKCMICHEGLSTAPTYELPECKHTYHTHCIVTWFRHRPREGTFTHIIQETHLSTYYVEYVCQVRAIGGGGRC